jgi:hypothetical protein
LNPGPKGKGPGKGPGKGRARARPLRGKLRRAAARAIGASKAVKARPGPGEKGVKDAVIRVERRRGQLEGTELPSIP